MFKRIDKSKSKNCGWCGGVFYRDTRNTHAHWNRAKFCSRGCSARSGAKARSEKIPNMETHFWSMVSILGEDECWEWTAARDRDGYGIFSYKGKTYRANRMSLKFTGTELEDGLLACHTCDNPWCVNPKHLYLGSNADNTSDKLSRGRQANGSDFPFSKLTESNVREIRASSKSNGELAKIFGVTPSNISQIKCRVTWKHV